MEGDEAPGESLVLRGEENVAVRIKLEREGRGWSTNAVSDRLNEAGYEINPSAVWRIENRKRRVNLDEAIGFAELFGISLENLVGPPRLAAHARAMELVEGIRLRYREMRLANRAAADARDALDAYLAEHPDLREEADVLVSNAIAEDLMASMPPPGLLHQAPPTEPEANHPDTGSDR
ncbi:helix-turn-helix domain-containing protein [Streptomyces caniferus]|uniref:helix-turn-helix transcriptional regulator n=1 Tax=Streptomyces caniferus TaxID=285557 RepID=UPI002E29F0EB|nr:helix-turn-helix transcriptional regulator [Streptomyces caniferus]